VLDEEKLRPGHLLRGHCIVSFSAWTLSGGHEGNLACKNLNEPTV